MSCWLLAVAVSVGSTPADAADRVVLQLRWVHQFQFAGYYAALEKGYYAREGLDVEIRPAGPGRPGPLDQVVGGDAQYGVGNAGLIVAYERGKPVVALAALFQRSANIWLTLELSKIRSLQDLAQKRLMMTVGPENAELLTLFANEGIQPDRLNIAPSTFDVDDLVGGRTDAFNAYQTNEPYLLDQRNIRYRIFDPHDYGIDFYSDVLFTSKQELSQHPGRVAAFRKASLDGWRYALDHPDEIVDLIVRQYGPGKSREHLLFEAGKVREIMQPDLIEIGHMNPARWQRILDSFVRLNMAEKSRPLDEFLYHPEEPDWLWLKWTAGGLALVTLIIALGLAIVSRFNMRLRKEVADKESAQQALEGSVYFFRESQRAAQIGSYSFDFTADKWTASETLDQILGIDRHHEHSLDSWLALVHPDDREVMRRYVQEEVVGKGISFDKPYRVIRPSDGQTRWMYGRGEVRFGADGQPAALLGTIQDITDRQRAELELQRYQEGLETLVRERTSELNSTLSQLSDTMFAIDAVGIGIQWVDEASGHFVFANRYASELFGYSTEEMLHLGPTDIDATMGKEEFAALLQRVRQEGHLKIERQAKARDGRLIPLEVRIYYLAGKDAGAGRFIGFFSDITRRKAAEQALLEAKETAESATIAKSAFLANMSHEIRTPLNAITGMTHLIRRGGLSSKQTEQMAKLEAAAEHLLDVINAILELSRIEAGKIVLEEQPIRVETLLDSVVSMFHEQIKAKDLQWDVEANNIPGGLSGDLTRVRQSLINYVGNAIKFTDAGGITIRARPIEETASDALIHFEVQDTGIGIAPEVLPKLFQAFEQADVSTTRKYGGTGLGLAITKKVAQLMGGDAGAESTPGFGSTFWFSVRLKRRPIEPAAAGTRTGEDPEARLKARFSGANVLVAEDEPINREIATGLLEDVGLSVDVAEDGAEAVAHARRKGFHLILMDMQMPTMDGLEATRQIRQLAQHRATPIIAMTANAFAEDKAHCLDAGMNDFLTKPVDAPQLYAVLLGWLEKNTESPLAQKHAMSFKWSDRYSVGNDVLDGQHKRLLSLCRDATECLDQDEWESSDEFHRILHDMSRYAEEHFATEESMLERRGFPSLNDHRQEHENYVATLADFLASATGGRLDRQGVTDFLLGWWIKHILNSDMAYKAFLTMP